MEVSALLFYAFASLALISAVAMVAFVRHAVAGVLSLTVTMVSLAGIFVLLEAHLVAAIQIMVYAGAILVLILFVVMLLNLREDDFGRVRPGRATLKLAGSVLAVCAFALLVQQLRDVMPAQGPAAEALPAGFGGYRAMGIALYTDYVVPVETVGLLLLAAIVGAVILAKRRID